MRAILVGAAVCFAAQVSALDCPPGTYFHDRGSFDCDPKCDKSNPTPACCCTCGIGFFCPGETAVQAEEPCFEGTTSPPGSTSLFNCTGPTPAIGQIHIAYTGVPGQFSVDFVSAVDSGSAVSAFVYTSADNATWSAASATTFEIPTIGVLAQALLSWPGVVAGQRVYYKVGTATANSSGFEVEPILKVSEAQPEVFVVYGDFGAANDACMTSLISDAAAGVFDTVLHVGDWAYNFDTANSTVGNVFMQYVQSYAAVKPVMPAEGNHEACTDCAAVPGIPFSSGNFSEYQARLWSVATVGAGKTSGADTNRYYSFNQGLVHFITFTAEAYAYNSGPEFIANQLAFMKADLAAVDRTVTPWVVGLVHKAFWMEDAAWADFNPLLIDGGVDVIFAGHVHYYNRLYPYNNITGDIDYASVSSDGGLYSNPKYPVNIISGAPGDRESTSKYVPGEDAWSYTGSSNYGYGFFSAVNATTATWTYKTIRPAGDGPVDYSDSLVIVQKNHGLRNGGKALLE